MQNIEDVKTIINKFNQNGFEAYIVGGFVRDRLLNRYNPNADIDIATNATPEQMMQIFDEYIPTGLKHGTISIKMNDEYYETTTYRIDGQYNDNRRPENVRFVDNIELDLSRRDLTINAIALNPITSEIIDPFNGKDDLNNKLIKSVGIAEDRFEEDSLRIMRTFRFASQLDFQIDKDTLNAIWLKKKNLNSISIERIVSELKKIVNSKNNRQQFDEMLVNGIFQQIPFFNQFKMQRLLDTFKLANQSSQYRFELWIALLISNIQFESQNKYFSTQLYQPKLTHKSAQSLLKLSNSELNIVENFINAYNFLQNHKPSKNDIKIAIYQYGFDVIKILNQIHLASQYSNKINQLININWQLPIRSKNDINFSWNDLPEIKSNIENQKQFKLFYIVTQLIEELIITNQIENNNEDIKNKIIEILNNKGAI